MISAENRKAYFDYSILETYEAGVVLTGIEVKAAKAGKINLTGAYAVFQGRDLYLINCTISPYQEGNTPEDYDAKRSRKLLLHKKELEGLEGEIKKKGLTLVPLKVYIKAGLVKILLSLALSKKKFDKREKIKKREAKREIERRMKG